MNPPNLSGIERAVQAAGSQAALASMLASRSPGKAFLSQQAISQFIKAGYAPIDRAKEISGVTGVAVADLVSPKVRELFSDMA